MEFLAKKVEINASTKFEMHLLLYAFYVHYFYLSLFSSTTAKKRMVLGRLIFEF